MALPVVCPRYLVESKAAGADGKKYALGENALDEINSEEVKAFISMVRSLLHLL